MTSTSVSPRLTPEAVSLIKHFESLKLDAYSDPVGVPTVGYGHTSGVRLGTSVTAAEADELLRLDLNEAQADVMRCVKVPLSDNEYGALVSLAFNIGGRAFSRSRCLAMLNKGDRSSAASEFGRFVNGHVGGRKVTLRGLQLRREAERQMFCAAGAADADADADAISPPQQALPSLALPPVRAMLPAAVAALPRAWASRRPLAVAAGVGTGLGAVPALDDRSGQSLFDQIHGLWQSLNATGLPATMQAWISTAAGKLAQLAHAASTPELFPKRGHFCNRTRR